jgi:hypothetical protein
LTVVKRFPYRGDTQEEWSNTYHFRQAPPATSADWKSFADAFINEEKPLYHPHCHVTRAYGYDTDDAKPVSVWGYDYGLAGEEVPGTGGGGDTNFAGDQAAMLWWKLDHKNSRGKYVYLRKYMHDGEVLAGASDDLAVATKAAYELFVANLWSNPTPAGGGIRARTGTWPVIAAGVSPYVTTRTLRRRGKRPLAHP